MAEKIDLVNLLAQEGLSVQGAVIKDSSGNGQVFVYVPVRRNSEGHQVPSNRSLHRIQSSLLEEGLKVEFILTDSHSQDIEAGIRATMLHAFGDDVRNAFLSTEGCSATVWLEPKREISMATHSAIERKIRAFLREVGLELSSVLSTNSESLPSKFALLKALRHVAPADVAKLKAELILRGLTVPSEDWLRRKLDTLRKGDSIVRLGNGSYAIPAKTLDSLGTQRVGGSPDVARLLALVQK